MVNLWGLIINMLTMKNLFILVLAFIFTYPVFSQVEFPVDKGKISYSEVITDSLKKPDLLFLGAKEFFSTSQLIENKEPIKLSDKDSKKVIGNIERSYTGGTMGCVRVFTYSFDAIIQFREGRYRYEITNFAYTHYNQNGNIQQVYGMSDKGACKSSAPLEEFLECNKCKGELRELFAFIDSDTKTFIEEMKKYLTEYEEDEW